ncbi:MAG: MBOAT family protein [Kiritimatiellae bacterium]|jgi:alginate O-acetyltransferase complex protein AlgI|nr:MBOAT family protein [Kiritimatiellia bacterium]
MLFNSLQFIFLFLPIVLVIFFLLMSRSYLQIACGWLVAASLFFYGWWNPKYLILILFSMLFNYGCGRILTTDAITIKKKKALLIIGLSVNILVLGYYKYTGFFIEMIGDISGVQLPVLTIVLPLAISFFTFQQCAYLVDAYRGECKDYNFLHYCLFVTFFAQLIAGPIVHHREMMPQFDRLQPRINWNSFCSGLFLFSMGLFKKVVIADFFSRFANSGFEQADILTQLHAWITILSYTFQLYFDFSGYTDMALGSGLLFGIVLPQNFNSPYKARSIQEFWQRWHMTLSHFLRDYVYIPMGGNRKGSYRVYQNLIITFLIGGFWHGANWTFLAWGALHGVAICINHYWSRVIRIRLANPIASLATFLFIISTWVVFRAQSIGEAWSIWKSMFFGQLAVPAGTFNKYIKGTGLDGWIIGDYHFGIDDLRALLFCILALICVKYLPNSFELKERFKPGIVTLIFTLILFIAALANISNHSEFLYFQF